MPDWNVVFPLLNFVLLCVASYLLTRVKKSAEVTAKKVADERWWPVELARELQKRRGLQREGRRYKSYGMLWKSLRPLAISDKAKVDNLDVVHLSGALTDWYFSEYGGLLLTRQAREFYFALQGLLRDASSIPEPWSAPRTGELEGDSNRKFRDVLEMKFKKRRDINDKDTISYEEAIKLVDYFKDEKFEDWQKVAVEKGEKWKRTIEQLTPHFKDLKEEQRFAVLAAGREHAAVGSHYRSGKSGTIVFCRYSLRALAVQSKSQTNPT